MTKIAKGKSSSGPRGICLVKRSELLGWNDFKDHRESVSGTNEREREPGLAWPPHAEHTAHQLEGKSKKKCINNGTCMSITEDTTMRDHHGG
jgi:hypothetical protein